MELLPVLAEVDMEATARLVVEIQG
jgi:hypothetical protein